jgi:DHA2 family multidrug resistance protein
MAVIYPGRLRGWRFILLNGTTGLANVVVLSNVPGYTILAPHATATRRDPELWDLGYTDNMIGLASGFRLPGGLRRAGDYRVYGTRSRLRHLLFSRYPTPSGRLSDARPLELAGGVILPVGQTVCPTNIRSKGPQVGSVLSVIPLRSASLWEAVRRNVGWRTLFLEC